MAGKNISVSYSATQFSGASLYQKNVSSNLVSYRKVKSDTSASFGINLTFLTWKFFLR